MLKIASFSDIHLGHRRNRSDKIIAALNAALPDDSATADLDIIFLVGDVFDRLLDLANENISDIDLWINRLIRLCSKHSIVLRILEGTPSHDRKQSKRFDTISNILGLEIDLKYVDTLSIEYIPKLNINVLYVPDEWDVSTEKTYAQVQELLIENNLKKVDYALMHGQFNYQLTQAATKAPRHDEESYLNIVKHLIFVGHIHEHSSFKRIYSQGSFDRLGHGEETPKGHLRATVETDGTYRVTFIENKLAKKYITIDCTNKSLEDSFTKINKVLAKLPNDSCIRIQANSDNAIVSDLGKLITLYPDFIWTRLIKDKENEITVDDDLPELGYVPITITKDNVAKLLLDRLSQKSDNATLINNAKKHLLELL